MDNLVCSPKNGKYRSSEILCMSLCEPYMYVDKAAIDNTTRAVLNKSNVDVSGKRGTVFVNREGQHTTYTRKLVY